MAVTVAETRKIALSLPEAVEMSHFDQPDFRVRKKIFASLHADKNEAVVKLQPEEQQMLVESAPKTFSPVPGGWGQKGWTVVHLKAASAKAVREAMLRGWRNVAPKTLLKEHDGH
ncbi:MAG: MmcQ/YjbR family DNA-binding protein [Parvibaculaceae bacterium]